MNDVVSDLLQRARSLPIEERERLVAKLLESLNQSASVELDPAWDAEIKRRLDAFDRGEVTAIDAEEVFAEAARLAK